MTVSIDGAFVYFVIPILGGIPVSQTMVSQLFVTILLCTAAVLLGKNLTKRPGKLQVLVEKGVTMLRNMVAETMGEHNVGWTPFIGTIFLSSLAGSYIGLTGFLRSTTADVATVLVWSIMVSVIIWANSIKHNGFLGWLKGYTEPFWVMTPMNVISEIAQPVAMAFRHFGNVAGGGIISSLLYTALSLASSLLIGVITSNGWLISALLVAIGIGLGILWKRRSKKRTLILAIIFVVLGITGLLEATGILTGIPILAYGIPAVLSCYFDLFSGFIQAYVFSLLTMVYISGSLPGPEEA